MRKRHSPVKVVSATFHVATVIRSAIEKQRLRDQVTRLEAEVRERDVLIAQMKDLLSDYRALRAIGAVVLDDLDKAFKKLTHLWRERGDRNIELLHAMAELELRLKTLQDRKEMERLRDSELKRIAKRMESAPRFKSGKRKGRVKMKGFERKLVAEGITRLSGRKLDGSGKTIKMAVMEILRRKFL